MIILSIASTKGGVSKTTTAVNLGAALTAGDNRVLLIALDSECHHSNSSGYIIRHLSQTAFIYFLNFTAANKMILTDLLKNLRRSAFF